jgi:hypothetical protein
MKEWESLLAKMQGQLCWSMIGISGGSMFSLHFGDKLKRDIVVDNEKLREDQRKFHGAYTLLVRMTGWRLYHDKKCLCHCNDSNANDGPMVIGLRRLEGKKLLHFESGKSPAELKLTFSEEYQLTLSDWEGVNPEDEAYTLFGDELAVTVRMAGAVSVQLTKPSRH